MAMTSKWKKIEISTSAGEQVDITDQVLSYNINSDTLIHSGFFLGRVPDIVCEVELYGEHKYNLVLKPRSRDWICLVFEAPEVWEAGADAQQAFDKMIVRLKANLHNR